MSAPWRQPEDGPVPIRGVSREAAGYLTAEDDEGEGLEFYAAVLEK